MKTKLISLILAMFCISATAQNADQAKKILDKTAAVVGNKNGASASFKMSSEKIGTATGTIAIKGRKFQAVTPKAIVWFDGKTQWSYLKSTNEVNITTPTEAKRMKMNPYTFITMYKTGYNMGVKTSGSNYVVHLTAQNKQRSVQELYVTVNKTTYTPVQVRMKEGNTWTTINISNFKAAKLPDSTFTFNAKDYPTAEVIDLR
ncbi:MAG: LolA-like putative outer membrane lipoprotein chaperone [Prevotella sp.]